MHWVLGDIMCMDFFFLVHYVRKRKAEGTGAHMVRGLRQKGSLTRHSEHSWFEGRLDDEQLCSRVHISKIHSALGAYSNCTTIKPIMDERERLGNNLLIVHAGRFVL